MLFSPEISLITTDDWLSGVFLGDSFLAVSLPSSKASRRCPLQQVCWSLWQQILWQQIPQSGDVSALDCEHDDNCELDNVRHQQKPFSVRYEFTIPTTTEYSLCNSNTKECRPLKPSKTTGNVMNRASMSESARPMLSVIPPADIIHERIVGRKLRSSQPE